MHSDKVFVTMKEAAMMMSISEDTVRRLVYRGALDSVKLGSLRRIRVESMLRYGRTQTPDSQDG